MATCIWWRLLAWKTTLGIEFIRRFGQPTLILAPTVTIRQQWVDRIVQAFLKDEGEAEHLISQDLKHPKLITVATYQALHKVLSTNHCQLTLTLAIRN